ncbi:TPA: tail fiber assembly protein [Proteus mirabilis]|uniref:tail fiber assembly protein n=1 Tax=Proteus mirabilis TaxID=584 RepID=UPI00071D59F6|nr:tail fiber assembly protein [Proteus mirabilis]AND12241.1 hypothetical protein AOUC001_04905 [Proteus mirabilis]KSA06901.1 hypothetical protein AC442_08015 [Proteus mirabilis]MDM3599357.1 tail fiber assembly protein [Proteus mirabilis]MDM3603294.1 tail fiber assembly protein [Proteus mirabilis]MDM3607014.1 tail fiber assembly protein [Proteus mirabilis]
MIESIKNIRQHREIPLSKGVECEVKFSEFDNFIPYFALSDDCELLGREVYQKCISGDYGDILPPLPLTDEELIAIEKNTQQALLQEALNVIAPLKDAQDGGYIEHEDIPRLIAWQKYRYELTKVDLSTYPDIKWPQKPE